MSFLYNSYIMKMQICRSVIKINSNNCHSLKEAKSYASSWTAQSSCQYITIPYIKKSNQETDHKLTGAWYCPKKTPTICRNPPVSQRQILHWMICPSVLKLVKHQQPVWKLPRDTAHVYSVFHKYTHTQKRQTHTITKPSCVLSDIILIYSEFLCFPQCERSKPPSACRPQYIRASRSSTNSQQGSRQLFDGCLRLNEKWELSIDRINRHVDAYLSSFTSQNLTNSIQSHAVPSHAHINAHTHAFIHIL